jgi:hypothetical protein
LPLQQEYKNQNDFSQIRIVQCEWRNTKKQEREKRKQDRREKKGNRVSSAYHLIDV